MTLIGGYFEETAEIGLDGVDKGKVAEHMNPYGR